MLNEAINYLRPLPGLSFIDSTLGDGGHALELLRAGSRVLGVDVYDKSVSRATKRIQEEGLSDDFIGVKANFRNLEEVAVSNGFGSVNGVLFDLGYSSAQLEEEKLGLSFLKDEPLDMRLDSTLNVTAEDLLNTVGEKQLAKIISEYGGERLAKRFAKEIVNFRKLEKLHTSKQLAGLLENAAPSGYERGRIHPATRTFQALRIAVNDEIDNLKKALPQAARLLLPGGRMVAISFHSLEDRAVKQFGRQGVQPRVVGITKKPLRPTPEEVQKNVRARSAKMRVYERV
jgi:16S rRNA (cytosine1402-N4)-methyltransferase